MMRKNATPASGHDVDRSDDHRARLFGGRYASNKAVGVSKERLGSDEDLMRVRNIEDLEGQVSGLKAVSSDIHDAIKLSSKVVSEVGRGVDSASALVRIANLRIRDIMKSGSVNNVLRLTGFAALSLFLLWIVFG